MKKKNALLLLSFFVAVCSFCSPVSPGTPDGMPPPTTVDMAAAADQAAAPGRLLSVTPTTAKINADTLLRITGSNLQLDRAQASVWDFGTCRIAAYTYTPVDEFTCTLQIQVGAVATGPCDLTLSKGGKAIAAPLRAAFSLVP